MKNPFDWQTMDWQKGKRKVWSTQDAREKQMDMKLETFLKGFAPPKPEEKKKEEKDE